MLFPYINCREPLKNNIFLIFKLQAVSIDRNGRNIIDDIINKIKETAEKLQQAISDLINGFNNIINTLKDIIASMIDQIDLEGFLKNIQKRIEKILSDAGIDVEAASKCIDDQKTATNQLIANTKEEVTKCQKVAYDRTEELREELDELNDQASALVSQVGSGTKQCFKEHGIHIIDLVKCLQVHLSSMQSQVDSLIVQIKDTFYAANKTAADITLTLTKCVVNINLDLISGEKEIIANFNQCVANLVN